MDFFYNSEDKNQIKYAKECFQKTLKLANHYFSYKNFKFTDLENLSLIQEINKKYKISICEEKIKERLKRLLNEKAKEVMENPDNMDFRMYTYVLENIV